MPAFGNSASCRLLCTVAQNKVTVSELPYSVARESSVWSETDWLSNDDYSFSPSPRFGEKGPGDEGHGSEKLEVRSVNSSEAELGLLTYPSEAYSLLIPIEQVPLGARIPTKNPKPWEFDDSLPDPVQADWAKISIMMHRNDGGIVDAELIRPGRLLEGDSWRLLGTHHFAVYSSRKQKGNSIMTLLAWSGTERGISFSVRP